MLALASASGNIGRPTICFPFRSPPRPGIPVRSAFPALRIAAPLALVLAYTACGGDGPTQPGSQFTGVRATLGANATDTVLALQPQALIVEVRGTDGRAAKGVTVRFEAQPSADTTRRNEAAINVCQLTSSTCTSPFVSDTTDDQGHAKAMVRMGTVAGKAVIRLLVPELGMVDSVTFTVTPGAAARVRALTADTALDIGATAALRGRVTDRFNNTRADVPTMSLGTGTAATLDAATGTVTGKDMGTQWLYARFGSFVDSTIVRVVPAGRLVVWSSLLRQVRLVNTNGSAVVTLASNVSSDNGAFPRFDAARQRVTLHAGTASYGGPSTNIVVADTGPIARRDIAGTTTGFTAIISTRQLADGTLLVVGQQSGTAFSLWRVGTDGSVALAAGLPAIQGTYGGADIARDGSKVVYYTSGVTGSSLRLLDVGSGTTTDLPVMGSSPRLSPSADRVAYLRSSYSYDGAPAVVNVDGTNATPVNSLNMSPGLSWSSDGAYLLGRASDYSGLRLIRMSDGATVSLRFRASAGGVEDYYQPDWR